MSLRLILALLLFALPASAQVVELTGGSSTEYNATGGAISLYTPGLATQVAAGIYQGRFVVGASTNFDWREWNVHAGDEPISLTSGDLSLSEPVRGIVATKRKGSAQFTVFGGLVGTAYAAPFFYAQRATQFGAGFNTSFQLRGIEFGATSAVAAGKRTYLESVRKRWQHFGASQTAGLLESRFYFIGQGNFQSEHLQAGITHSDYVWNGLHAAVNSESITANARGLSGFGSVFQSATVSGSAVGASWRVGMFDVHATEVLSKQKFFTGSVGETFGQHFRIAQYVSRSNGQTSFNVGGGYVSNLVTADVGWQMLFYPFASTAPFQRTLTVNIGFQLPFHGTRVHVGTVASPSGGTKWSAYAGTYASLPWQPATWNDQRGQSVRITGFEIRGTVTLEDGSPLEGAAIKVGRDIVYTSSDGAFLERVKRNGSVPVIVALDEFVAPGTFAVVSCPSSASPDAPILITVKRQ